MRKIVAGNWKMNKNIQQGKELCNSILNQLETSNKEVILAVPYTHLTVLAELIRVLILNLLHKIAIMSSQVPIRGKFLLLCLLDRS